MFSRVIIATFLVALAGHFGARAQTPSVMSTGQWYKFAVPADGVYKITYDMLQKAGFDPANLDPRKLQLYGTSNGMLPQPNSQPRINHPTQLAIVVTGEQDGKFDKDDVLLFYGQGPDVQQFVVAKNTFLYQNNLFTDKNYYLLTVGTQSGKRNATATDAGTGFPVVNQFDDFAFYETEKYNILKSGRNWYGEQFDAGLEITVRFDIAGIVPNTSAKFVSAVMAQAYASNSTFRASLDNNQIAEQSIPFIDGDPEDPYIIKGYEDHDTITFNTNILAAGGTHDIHYQYIKATSGPSTGYLDNFLLSFTRELALYDKQTIFRSGASLANSSSTFQIKALPSTAAIWDVTDPFTTIVQPFTTSGESSRFSTSTTALKQFVIFLSDNIPAAETIASVPNQDILSFSSPDLLIITHPDFKSEALRLAGHRQSHDNLATQVVTTTEIFNEYSSGKQDVTAIRDFVREVYNRPGSGLKNLLLVGRCSYDHKSRVPNNTNLLPTYESRNSLAPLETYSSDDYFTFLDASEGNWSEYPADYPTMDIGVGRLSVVLPADATNVVDKLIAYDDDKDAFGAWRENFVFVADDGDGNLHQDQANRLVEESVEPLHPEIISTKTFLDDFKQIEKPAGQFSPAASEEIDRRIDKGALIINFTGHGSEEVWMKERVLEPLMIQDFKNHPRYPLFVTATCEFGRHDDPFQISTGELLQLKKKAGAIGLVTTSRPVNSSTNFDLNKEFYHSLFTKSAGQYRDLGTIFRETKNNSLSGVANRNFSLLGDPSMRLAMASKEVVITSIKTALLSDTLKALSTVTVKGEVQVSGVKQNSFQGEADVTLFDKRVSVTTRGDENAPFTYTTWKNILFRGSASVADGSFEVQFVVPKDVDAAVGQGKLTVYAQNNIDNATGSRVVKIGGLETNPPPDQTPPEIKLYIGDTTFVNGGIASPNTMLITRVNDASGLAITGSSGANNLLAILDDSLTYNMNDYYSAVKDDYRQGWAYFPLKGLQKGRHHVEVQASDTYSNRTSVTINFVITDEGLVISEFYNYPNPFWSLTESTILGFTHNRPGEDLEANIILYDLAGHLIDSQTFFIPESFTRVTLSEWAGTDAFGNKLGNGIYLGKLSVRSLLDGSKNEQITKLIILN